MHPHNSHAGLVLIVYGVILLIGGLYGYVKAKSTPSLIAGIFSALVAVFAGVIFRHHPGFSLLLGGLTGLVLTVVFYRRYEETKKPMPALPVGILSFFVFLYSMYTLVKVHHLMHG
jgi:uncharacterized membrane protein (UPF0136 family)